MSHHDLDHFEVVREKRVLTRRLVLQLHFRPGYEASPRQRYPREKVDLTVPTEKL
jgi:hypothetical protein